MTYEELVLKVRETYENADAREIFEHIAVQVNIEGEGEGAFYIEVADRQICVEPYDYYDRDGLMTTDAKTICDIADGKMTFHEAHEKGLLRLNGNMDKFLKLSNVKLPKLAEANSKTEKAAVKKAVDTVKKTVAKKSTKADEKKTTAKKTTAAKATAKKTVTKK